MRVSRSRLAAVAVAIVSLSGLAQPAASSLLGRQSPAAVQGTDAGVDDLRQDIDAILTDPRLAPGQAGVVVRSVAGEVLYSRSGEKALAPASNEKLLTSTAAVDALGTDYRFTTSVLRSGALAQGTLTGDLVLRGTGDPTTRASDYEALARQVAAAGVRTVTGRLVVDDTWFDDVRLGQDWSWDDEPYAYAAQLSALTLAPNADFDAGSVIVRVSPGPAAGSVATAALIPATGHVRIDNRATTSAAGSAQRIVVQRRHGTNTIVVTGSIPAAGAPVDALSSVDDPSLYAADVFRRALTANRVTVRGLTVRAATPSGATPVATHSSAPLGQILVPFLKLSNNNIAEILAKAVGRKVKGAGTWNAGQQAVAEFLAANGISPQTLRMRDGSGLSRVDGLPPAHIVKLLTAVQGKPWFSTWYDALPIAANPDRMVGGTLRSRMAGTPAANNVHAKTGSLTGVSALSGYVTTADGERLVFSIMLNGHLSAAPKDLEDAIAVRLAEFRRGVATAGKARTTIRPLAPARSRIQQIPDPGSLECSWYKDC